MALHPPHRWSFLENFSATLDAGKFILLNKLDELFGIRIAAFGLSILLGLILGTLMVFVPVPYILAGIGGIVFAYLLLFRIEVAVILSLLALEPLRQFNYLAGEIPLHPNGLIGIAIIAGTIWFILFNKIDYSRLQAHWSFLGFLVICFLSLIFAGEHLAAGITVTLRLVTALAIFIVLQYRLDSIKKAEWVIAAILGSQLWVTIQQLLRIAGSAGLTFSKEETFRLGNSGLGTSLANILILCLVMFLNTKTNLRRLLWGSLTVLFTVSLFLSYGRAGWIGFVIGVFIIGVMRHRKLLLFFPVLLILVTTQIPGISQRFDDISIDRLSDYDSSTLGKRITYWEAAIQIFQTRPFLGVGFGVEKYRVGEYLNKIDPSIHNDYLTVLVGTGLIGFIMFMLWFGQWITELLKVYRRSKFTYDKAIAFAVFAYFFTSLVVRLTDNLLQTTDDMYPIAALVAVTLALPRIRANEKKDHE
jgi:O-antigen ligase